MMEIISAPFDLIIGYVLPALAVLTVVVFFHELGHFQVARWCGVRVDAFSIGFGRELFGFHDRHGTRWKISAIPLGGYVKFTGDMNAASLPDAESMAAVPVAERTGLFFYAALWKRAAIVVAGPVANFILAIIIFGVLFSVIGRPVSVPKVDSVVAGSAAEKAGFQAGDIVTAIDGSNIGSFSDIQRTVMLAAGDELQIEITRSGNPLTLLATPERREMDDGFGGTQRIGVLGISRSIEPGDIVYQTYTPLAAVGEGMRETWTIIERTMTYIKRLFSGRETADQLSGPLRVAQVSGIVAEQGGLTGLIHLASILSVSIGLLNLFPVPMLDGGHLVFYLIEALRGRPLSQKAQDVGFRIGLALVIMLFVFVTFNDIVKLAGI